MSRELFSDAGILIADDSKVSIGILVKILTEAGYANVTSTSDSSEVMELYDIQKPDLLILDLHMPHMEGFRIMEQLKEKEMDMYLPILVISQERDKAIQFSALEAGAKDFLVKPYDSVEVLVRIRNFLEARMMQKEIRDQNMVLEQRVHERTRQLYKSQIDAIQRLSRAVEYRDSETGAHTMRMGQYVHHLAEALGFSEGECEVISTASSLHDVGKIGIPDSILKKPAALTPEEREIMKTHTTIGVNLLSGSNSKFFQMGKEIALTHHEKWDGSGYPNGLKGEEIPLSGRICGLCDVFDALTSKRPYKEAWTIDKAVEEVTKNKGTHFDPHIVDCFIKILPQIRRIHVRPGSYKIFSD